MTRRTSWPGLLARAALFGFVAGLRSQTPLAVLAVNYAHAPRAAGWRHWFFFRSRWGRQALVAGWAVELVVDKLPVIPPRIEPGPLAGRAFMGGVAGAAIASARHGAGARLAGITTGALGAIAGSYAGYHARQGIEKQTGLPDPIVALGEDALAFGVGWVTARA